jgi:hypothetical protein
LYKIVQRCEKIAPVQARKYPHMRTRFLFCCIALSCITGCAVLSDSQMQNVHTYAVTAKNYSAFPGQVVRKAQLLQYNNNVLEASALTDSTLIIRSLDVARSQYEKGIRFSKKMDLSLHLVQQYAALLAQLSSDKYTDELGSSAKDLSGDLKGGIDAFNAALSSKIPDNVGKGLAEIITIIGDRYIRNKQAKAIQRFVPMGDTLIQITSANLISALEEDMKPLIDNYKATFQNDFKTLIFNNTDRINYNILQFYIKSNADYVSLETLRKKCVRSALKMASSHRELADNLAKKKDLKELLAETKDFISDVKELYEVVPGLFNND